MYRDAAELLELLHTKDEEYWIAEGEKMALDLFHRAAERVPAYKDFLQKSGVRHEKIQSVGDFKGHVPVIDKEAYIAQYSFDELRWHMEDAMSGVVYSSSGTTGEPTFWLRNSYHDREAGILHGVLLQSFFRIDKYKTLFIDCFAMGIHVAGFITATAINQVARESKNVFLATPGSKKEDIVATVARVGYFFEQIVMIGYPPLIKDVVADVAASGFEWRRVKAGFLLAAQGFSEKWRRQLIALARGDEDTPVINIYGSADAGAMAFETQFSIGVRRALETGQMSHDFGLPHAGKAVPFLFQYIPEMKYFESADNELIVTADNGIPLIRYNIHDLGGVARHGELAGYGREPSGSFKLPFVFVYGRSNYSVVFYGANVYPEHLLAAIEHDLLADRVSGRFFMEIGEGEDGKQKFHMHIELKKGHSITGELESEIARAVTDVLCKVNREFLVVFREMGNEDNVIIHLHEEGSEEFQSKKMKYRLIKRG
ncbi:MAG: hypothetical protein A3C90_00805 [Candidatus Magasanikbacteria bacterium RIFCSPHIGHO2_02_FULL_51_14]|uniref:AMP-dependent synthetase/ligase domain-containing protein n=1 Tax=Candidatus Magasanikbacteria bacterium RIFCSPHIGHO2_02_FULL_51_14 TaxID=1798683 RepID=A0A1F6MQ96_9BACT|nr:MAG: hypothetical protein A3C90_00805 [Candidatus Magasanikbacteria bacterium RIFCSPHIGHO2_02_FULL_51_14]